MFSGKRQLKTPQVDTKLCQLHLSKETSKRLDLLTYGVCCTEKVKKRSGSEQASNDIYIIWIMQF